MTVTFGRWRLLPYDRLNWRLQELRGPRNNRARDDGESWHDTGNYFSNLGHALAFVLDREAREDGGDYDLAGAVERVAEIAASLRESVGVTR